MTYSQALRQGLLRLISEHNAYILGEDIADPYGGAFRITRGLSTEFPDNILSMPMSEQGFTALAIGMALRGEYVIEEIMFGDFITLAADQLINHAAKFRQLYGSELHYVFRAPSGGYRGYGATHSQSLEKLFLGIPGLRVVAPNNFCDPGELLVRVAETGEPTVFVENKSDYPMELRLGSVECFERLEHPGWIRHSLDSQKPEWSIVTYGGMAALAVEAALELFYEVEIPISVLSVTDLTAQAESFSQNIGQNILVLEEGVLDYGWGAEMAAQLVRFGGHSLHRVGTKNSFIPAAPEAEQSVLPGKNDIKNIILKGQA